MHRWKRKPPRQQPPSSYAGCTETSTEEDVDVGKDFGTLVDAPLSKGGHFVFKSERDWSAADCSSEFFTLNLNMLSAAIDCIPFNGYVDVDDRYFTSDQLTSIYNDAERGRRAFEAAPDDAAGISSRTSNVAAPTEDEPRENTGDRSEKSAADEAEAPSEDGVGNLEDDIDFLLSLTEPVQTDVTTPARAFPKAHNYDSKSKLENNPTKPVDLEKWLDSVLDD